MARPATTPQLELIQKLTDEKDWQNHLNGAEWERAFDVSTRGDKSMTFDEAHATINQLLGCPKKGTQPVRAPRSVQSERTKSTVAPSRMIEHPGFARFQS